MPPRLQDGHLQIRKRGEEDGDDEEEEECVYMFRYPRGSLKVSGSVSHLENPATFLTVALHVCVCVYVGGSFRGHAAMLM